MAVVRTGVRIVVSAFPFRQSRWQTTASSLAAAPAPQLRPEADKPIDNLAVNFFFTRKCNMSCKFCFHTAKTSDVMDTKDALKLITDLREAGASKLNFAGGEPFLPRYRPLLAAMVRHAREVGFVSVSIISNGSMLNREWFLQHGRYVTMLGISCDSIVGATNLAIGRVRAGSTNGADQAKYVRNAAALCRELGIPLKVNTVVSAANAHEDMSPFIAELLPTLTRWKLFQVLPLAGENTGREGELRDVTPLLISDDVFKAYVARARAGLRTIAQAARAAATSTSASASGSSTIDAAGSGIGSGIDSAAYEKVLTIEDNATMQSSYLLIDEYGRFLDCSGGGKTPTEPILKVGVREAVRQLRAGPGGGFDGQAFLNRDGQFYLR